MLCLLLIFLFFFSNDFGLIDVEKTSIITAIAIDKQQSEYLVTAQIAVPEATDTNSENLKAQLSGKGTTVGGAIKDLGDISGWFPKLAFCNLIILGNGFEGENVITVLDYFAKTLRIQDSALVVFSEKTAQELLEIASPLDNISSFALQKVILKNTGFDRDVASTDIKTFCSGHYSDSRSAYMPYIKILPANVGMSADEDGNSSGSSSSSSGKTSGSSGGTGGQEGQDKTSGNYLFDARTTALFLGGVKVGELDDKQTLAFNALKYGMGGTTINVDGISFGNEEQTNYLLTIRNSIPSVKLTADVNDLTLNLSVRMYCKISDHNVDGEEHALSVNKPLPDKVKQKAEENFTVAINELIETSKQTGCDFLEIKEKLYRYNFKQYSRYKDNFLSQVKANINVTITGQK